MNKSLLLFVLFALVSSSACAQCYYKPFRVDAGLGCGISTSSGYKTSVFFALEPKYAVSPSFAIGARLEAGIMSAKTYVVVIETPLPAWCDPEPDTDFIVKMSVMATLDWYILPKAELRPFVGCGVGGYFIPDRSFDKGAYAADIPAVRNLGGMMRVGVDYWHIRLAAEYNLGGKDSFGNRIDYVGIKLSFILGGGDKM